MRNLLIALALVVGVATAASAYCRTDPCPAGSANAEHTQCCAEGGVPAGPEACGQVSIPPDVIGGCANEAGASGCIDGLNVGPGGVADCGTTAVDACIACGCSTDTGC